MIESGNIPRKKWLQKIIMLCPHSILTISKVKWPKTLMDPCVLPFGTCSIRLIFDIADAGCTS